MKELAAFMEAGKTTPGPTVKSWKAKGGKVIDGMSNHVRTIQADVAIVGSGPGGATMARELSRKRKKVIICEAGQYQKRFGNTFLLLGMMDRMGLTFSKERTWVLRPKTVGGATVVFCGTAIRPPAWLKEKYGIDLKEEVEELYREIPLRPLPDRLIGPAAQRIMEAARSIGLDWNPLDKFIRPDKCKPNCGKCGLGCKEPSAKWTAREYVEEARQHGAELLTGTTVDRVLTQGGKAVGLRARGPKGWLNVLAETVIVSAGGQGTPPILQRSGVYDAGQGFFGDPLCLVVGPGPTQGSRYDVPMTAGINLERDGIVLTDIFGTPTFYAGLLAYSGPKGIAALPKALYDYNRTYTIMIKVRDGLDGRINLDESFSKPIDYDTQWKLNKGAVIAEEILQKAGVKREEILKTGVIAAHPGGTVRIGELLDKDCQTPIQNCYCMDTSIIPLPWGLPPTVTLVAMAKRLARHLTHKGEIKVGTPKSV
ncbi:MAG: GMC family oxidoreductase [bacterium]